MKVLKFGGTSLSNAAMMRRAAEIVLQNERGMVVVSAMSGVTNTLLHIAGNAEYARVFDTLKKRFEREAYELFTDTYDLLQISGELNAVFQEMEILLESPQTANFRNILVSKGELLTAMIFHRYLNKLCKATGLLYAPDIISLTVLGDANPDQIQTALNHAILQNSCRYYVIQGFICSDAEANISNLGRGGSDYSATLLGAALRSPLIEIWTDIDGLHNNDPRRVAGTFPLPSISYDEASELAYFGAKILHPSCVWPAQKYAIPIHIRNTYNPQAEGTLVSSKGEAGIIAVAAKADVWSIRITSGRMMNAYGFLKRVFDVFDNYRIPIDVITTSEVSVALTIDPTPFLNELMNDLKQLGNANCEKQQAVVCVVGDALSWDFTPAAGIISQLRNYRIKMISYGGERNNISFVVDNNDLDSILNHLQKVITHCRIIKTVSLCSQN